MASSGKILTPEGIMMLFIGGLFDVAGWICLILVWLAGVGVLAGQIVNVLGFIVIGGWVFLRSGSLPAKKGNPGKGNPGEAGGAVGGLAKGFLKKQWKKIVIEVCPVLGDIYPGFTLMVYSELK